MATKWLLLVAYPDPEYWLEPDGRERMRTDANLGRLPAVRGRQLRVRTRHLPAFP